METNYSQYDTLKGNKGWGIPIVLAIAFGVLYGGVKAMNNSGNSNKYDSKPETRIVSQNSDLGLLSECEGGMK